MSDQATSPVDIPGFRIIRELGRGGMASVYLAVQESLDREVALKVMSPALVAADADFSERFVNEGRTIAKLNHPNVVTVHDIAIANGHHYIAMEYIAGENLKQRMRRGLTPPEGIEIIQQVAGALGYAHNKGFVHRDVKPDNILLREDGTAVLTDFGIAKAADRATRMTATGMSVGTPHYMSPEQARGESVDSRADIYSLAVVLYEILVNEPLFDAADSFAIGIKHINEPVPRLPAELTPYQPVLDKALAKDPTDRYPDVESLTSALTSIEAATETGAVAPTELLHSVGKDASRSGLLRMAAGIAVLALLAGGAVFYAAGPGSMPGTQETDAPTTGTVDASEFARPIDSARELLQSGRLDAARDKLEEARALGAQEIRLDELSQRIEAARSRRQQEVDDLVETARERLAAGELDAAGATLDKARSLGAGTEQIEALSQRIEAARTRRQRQATEALESTAELLTASELDAARQRLDEARVLDADETEVAELARKIREAEREREARLAGALKDTQALLDADKLDAARARLSKARDLGAAGEDVAGLERRVQEMQTRRSLARELLAKASTALDADRLSEAIGHCESAREFFSGPLANDGVCERALERRTEVRQKWQQQNIGTQGTKQVE